MTQSRFSVRFEPYKVLGKAQNGEGEMRGQRELINVKPREKPKKSIPKKPKKLPKSLPKRVLPRPKQPIIRSGSRSASRSGSDQEVIGN